MAEFSFLTFNILANRFTNFNKENKKNELMSEMKQRYQIIINHLEKLDKDICFLQEVDNHFYYLLMKSKTMRNKYFITHRYFKALRVERNKDDIGQMILIKNSKFKPVQFLNNMFNKNNVANSEILMVRGGFSCVYDFIKLTKYGEEGNQRKFSHILIVKYIGDGSMNKNTYLILGNVHLEGNKDYQLLKELEFEETYNACVNFRDTYMTNMNTHLLFSGDFNEANQNVIEDVMIGKKPLKLINDDEKQMTSFSKYFTDKKTKERNVINSFEKLDYLICSKELTNVKEMKMYPDYDLRDMPNWTIPFEGNDEGKNWASDHKILYFFFKLPDDVIVNKNVDERLNNKLKNNKKKVKKNS